MVSPFDPVIPLLGLYPNDLKLACYSDAAISMYIAAQFTIARLWNQTRCPSTDERIKKTVVYIHNGILFSHKEEEEYYGICRKMDGIGEYHAK